MDEPEREFDTAWKQALEWFFEPFLAFFFPAAHADIDWSREPVFLDKELQQVVPEAESGQGTVDKLVKVFTPDGAEAWVLVHVEVQSQRDSDFARRMYTYNHRLEDRYGRMPVSLAVLGDDGPGWRPSSFLAGRWGCEVRFDFPAVKLLDYRQREVALETDPNPFAAVVLAHLKSIETHGDPDARGEWKFRLVKGLYDRGWTKVQIVQLFRIIDWVLTLPPVQARVFARNLDAYSKEKQVELLSPTYRFIRNEALNEGRAEGLAEGLAKGLAEGLAEGLAKAVGTLHKAVEITLKVRFGESGLELMPRIHQITDVPALEAFLDAIEAASDLDTLRNLLPPQA